MLIVIDSFTAVPDLRLGEKSSTRQTFQVLRLPWMAEVLEPPGSSKNLEGLTGSVLSRRDLSIRMTVKVGYQRNLRLIFFRAFRAFRGHCITSVIKPRAVVFIRPLVVLSFSGTGPKTSKPKNVEFQVKAAFFTRPHRTEIRILNASFRPSFTKRCQSFIVPGLILFRMAIAYHEVPYYSAHVPSQIC
jgi:hypothetical protein